MRGEFILVMDIGSIIAKLSDYMVSTPIYIPIISFIAILLVYLINKKYLWTVSKVVFGLVLAVSIYEIIVNTPDINVLDRIKTYFTGSDYSSGFYYLYLPLFIFSFLFSILFSIVDKIKNKIEVKINKLPR